MLIKQFEYNLFGVNTYVVYDTSSKEAAIVDPGMVSQQDCDLIDGFIASNSLSVKYLINTHMHIDHLFGDEYIKQKYGVGIAASTDDNILSTRIAEQARMFNLRVNVPDSLAIALPINDGDKLTLGHETIDILAVPGHSPGSVALYCSESGFVITGDALFNGSIGRTDLPGGNYAQLISSITNKLLTLPASTVVYPGHGPSSTIAHELNYNPYL